MAVESTLAATPGAPPDSGARLAKADAFLPTLSSDARAPGEPPRSTEAAGPADDVMIGRVVMGSYVVDRKLGRGGMGSVYLLRHRDLPNTFAALKVMSGSPGIDRARERFRQEALVASTVGGDRVVKPLDIGAFEDGTPYIVMEFVPGRSLAELLLESGPLAPELALRIALYIAETMAAAHAQGIIHRDLKPPNVMVSGESGGRLVVRILDFGIARATGAIKVAETSEAVIMGTPGYMSPEAVAAQAVDGRADVFALGVMVYEMLAGGLPFPAGSPSEAMFRVLSPEPAPPIAAMRPTVLPGVPVAVEAIVSRALAKSLAERPTMEVFKDLLVDVLSSRAGFAESIVQRAPKHSARHSAVNSAARSAAQSAVDSAVQSAVQSAAAPSAGRSMWTYALAGVIVIAAAAVASYSLVGRTGHAPAQGGERSTPGPTVALTAANAAPPAEPKPASAPGTTQAAAPAPPDPSGAARVHVRISTNPLRARLLLDGAAAANPMDDHVVRDGARHRLDATLAGYRDATAWVVFDQDRELEVRLEPLRTPRPAPARTRPPGAEDKGEGSLITDFPGQ